MISENNNLEDIDTNICLDQCPTPQVGNPVTNECEQGNFRKFICFYGPRVSNLRKNFK